MEQSDLLPYTKRIDQIDRIIKRPVESLARIFREEFAANSKVPSTKPRRLDVPVWVSEHMEAPQAAIVTSALCCSTLQRLWRLRRRFPAFEKALEKLRESLPSSGGQSVASQLADPFVPTFSERYIDKYVSFLTSEDFPPPDPLTASQVFWVLLNAGEHRAHTGMGFLAFFLMLWPLRRRFPDRLGAGAAIGSSAPNAWITAKTLAPLFTLGAICRRRATILEQVHGLVDELAKGVDKDKLHRFAFTLDELTSKLYELSEIAINQQTFRDCAQQLEETSPDANVETWSHVLTSLARALHGVGMTANEVLKEASLLVGRGKYFSRVCRALTVPERGTLDRLGLRFPKATFSNSPASEAFWQDQARAAGEAMEVCKVAFDELRRAAKKCQGIKILAAQDLAGDGRLRAGLKKAVLARLQLLADSNRNVAEAIEAKAGESLEWCHRVLTREIAHVTAKNWTEFDPAELVSSLFVAVVSRKIESPLPVGSALVKVLPGCRGDGSFIAGQPFFSRSGMGLWAPTSDIVWMLASTIAKHPGIDVADGALEEYLDWLERTRITLSRSKKDGSSERVTGWVSERQLEPRRIDLWATAFAVNALLSIRDLMEFRLGELCARRFTIISERRRLSELEAVDLGAEHRHRLHRRLAQMARRAEGPGYAEADYSLILSGPPGSSKTAISQALSNEFWQAARSRGNRSAQLIRITPADFTRKGEDRLDSEAGVIFDLLSRVRGVTVLFDEIDDLLRVRDPREDLSFMKLIVPAMLNRLQDLRDACPSQEICFILATNYIEHIEPALIRKGRVDQAIALVYPDRESRRAMVYRHAVKLRKRAETGTAVWAKDAAELIEEELAAARIADTDYWPWKTMESMCEAAGKALEAAWAEEVDQEEGKIELERCIREHKATVTPPPYEERLKNRELRRVELREELLQLLFSGSGDSQEYLAQLGKLMAIGKPDAKPDPNAVDAELGDGTASRIQDLWRIRSWEPPAEWKVRR